MTTNNTVLPAEAIEGYPESPYYLDEFRKWTSKRGSTSFAAVKIGGAVIDDPDSLDNLIDSLHVLRDLDLLPVIVHGGGVQISHALDEQGIERRTVDDLRYTPPEAMPTIARTLGEVNSALVERMEEAGLAANGLHGVIAARYKNRSRYGEVGEASGLSLHAVQEIDRSAEEGVISVISCLGYLASREGEVVYLNVNADNAARTIARTFKPRKLISVTPSRFVHDAEGNRLSVITSAKVSELIESGVVNGGMRVKLEEEVKAIRRGPVQEAVNVGPRDLLEELFTHEGAGTLLTDKELKSYKNGDIIGVSTGRLKKTIETAFNADRKNGSRVRLPKNYFDNPQIDEIIVTSQSYDGVGIIERPTSAALASLKIRYLDKLAVLPEAQGRGIARQIVEAASERGGLFWRSSEDNPNLSAYARMNQGRAKVEVDGKVWHVFWKGINMDGMTAREKEALKAELVDYAALKSATLVPARQIRQPAGSAA